MRRIRFVSLLIVVATLAGCASYPWLITPTATPTVFVLPTRTPAPLTANQTPIPIAQAWGAAQIAQFPLTFGASIFQPGGSVDDAIVTDDDQVCGVIHPNTTYDPNRLVESLALLNLHTGALTTLLTLPAGHFYMNCSVTGQWIIWIDQFNYVSNALFASWRVMALNRQTHEIRALDASKPQASPYTPANLTPFPVASNGKAVWLSDSANPSDKAVALYDFDSKQTTLIAHHADYPLLAWPWAAWGDTTTHTVILANLATQQRVTLNRAPSLAGMDSDTYAITDPHYLTLTLYAADQFSTPYIVAQGQSASGNYIMDPTLNDRLVTWQSLDGVFAFDRKLQRIVQLNEAPNPAPIVASHFLIWTQPHNANQSILSVIDTNSLP